jgi:hypothetical protein
MNAICLITLSPKKIWCDFLNTFTKYKIFIIVDDNNFDLSDFNSNYKNIHFIKIENKNCILNGYMNTSYITFRKSVVGWDKAFYYFGVENNSYEYIWFMEDDVFFNNENTLLNIDNQYVNDDLLSNKYDVNIDGRKKDWLWNRISTSHQPPYYNGMMCIVRFSNHMMKCINNYATRFKTLYFLEALIPTIANKNNLKNNSPKEFYNIHYRHVFKKEDINIDDLYHPIKDLQHHIYFRS